MKTLKIDDPVLSYDGTPFTDNLREGEDKTIRFKDIFIQVLGPMFQGKTGSVERVILANKVGQKLFDCEDETIELEDAEFSVLNEAAESQATIQRYHTNLLAPIYKRLKEVEE
jgi:hypothetical protein